MLYYYTATAVMLDIITRCISMLFTWAIGKLKAHENGIALEASLLAFRLRFTGFWSKHCFSSPVAAHILSRTPLFIQKWMANDRLYWLRIVTGNAKSIASIIASGHSDIVDVIIARKNQLISNMAKLWTQWENVDILKLANNKLMKKMQFFSWALTPLQCPFERRAPYGL